MTKMRDKSPALMKWSKRGKYLAHSACGRYKCAAFRVDRELLYRASEGRRWITPPLPTIEEINENLQTKPR